MSRENREPRQGGSRGGVGEEGNVGEGSGIGDLFYVPSRPSPTDKDSRSDYPGDFMQQHVRRASPTDIDSRSDYPGDFM